MCHNECTCMCNYVSASDKRILQIIEIFSTNTNMIDIIYLIDLINKTVHNSANSITIG